ncbi:MAG: RNA-protein complex protein Nop10 [Candidatus Odinarchaeum yellowstonii]|jgi:H/ACA ribonucleoprotein complex subunit 3|uniref:Ribosome biogenesis protein Nop10 n=1 Tax=Odinarchaeota yellowstonii (strain LCB_4) TaxID=1841599 RepID=A0AAF0D102_ODILC|nr:MAG: RNA-protein complex protein Nop10 [Candidatus Odinarchaeum yellowstonii]
MTKYLRKCTVCGKYTILKEICPYCSNPTRTPHPAKFSLTDNYGVYRRKLKRMDEDKS